MIRLLLDPRQSLDDVAPDLPERVPVQPGDIVIERSGASFHVYRHDPDEETGVLVFSSFSAALAAAQEADRQPKGARSRSRYATPVLASDRLSRPQPRATPSSDPLVEALWRTSELLPRNRRVELLRFARELVVQELAQVEAAAAARRSNVIDLRPYLDRERRP